MDSGKNSLFDTMMTRKEFVTYLAMALLTLFGVRDFINMFFGRGGNGLHHARALENNAANANNDFGTRKFGM